MLPSSDVQKIKILITIPNKKKLLQKQIQTMEPYPMCVQFNSEKLKRREFLCSMCLMEHTLDYCVFEKACNDCNEVRYRTCPCCKTCKMPIKDEATCTNSKECLEAHGPCDGKSEECDIKNKHDNSKASSNDSDKESDRRNKSKAANKNKHNNSDNIETGVNCYCKIKDKNNEDRKRHQMKHTENRNEINQRNTEDKKRHEIKHVENINEITQLNLKTQNNEAQTERKDKPDHSSKIKDNIYNVNKEDKSKKTKKCCREICRKKRDCSTLCRYEDNPGKVVGTQTSNATIDKDLLTEVLTVFQTKKSDPFHRDSNLLDCKSASVQVAGDTKKKLNTLSVSKLVNYSINENDKRDSGFMIMESHQPDKKRSTHSSLSSPVGFYKKEKSSSVPQMKLEELKYAMKQKSKPINDTVQEVNRMFAIVGKFEKASKDDLNRPLTRSGPRILPVVNTETHRDKHSSKTREIVNNIPRVQSQKPMPENVKELKDNYSQIAESRRLIQRETMCQTNDYMSGGDSQESCSSVTVDHNCKQCVYMLSCRHNSINQPLCDCCSGCRRRNICNCRSN